MAEDNFFPVRLFYEQHFLDWCEICIKFQNLSLLTSDTILQVTRWNSVESGQVAGIKIIIKKSFTMHKMFSRSKNSKILFSFIAALFETQLFLIMSWCTRFDLWPEIHTFRKFDVKYFFINLLFLNFCLESISWDLNRVNFHQKSEFNSIIM